MKMTFQAIIAPMVLLSSMALAQSSSIERAVPGFFEAGHITTIAVDSNSALPSSYQDFVEYVKESFGPDSVTYGPVRYLTNADVICESAPSSRACYHARSFQRIDEVPHAHQSEVQKHPDRTYRRYNLQNDVLPMSAQYPMSNQVYIATNEAILFSPNAAEQAKMVSAMRKKLSNTNHKIAVVYQVGPEDAMPMISAGAVPSDRVRIVDADCGYVGTPQEYLANRTCQ